MASTHLRGALPMGDHSHDHGASWDVLASDYAAKSDLVQGQLQPVSAALLDAAHAGPGTRLLDLACGPGHFTATARERGADAVGLDRSAAMVAAARARFPNLRFEVGDMASPPAGPWDAITCRFGAHHADPRWLAAARAVLRPGGRIALAELAPDAHEESHGKQEPSAWGRLLRAAGFDQVAIRSLHVPPPRDGGGAGFPLDRTIWVVSATRP